jgi:acyl CoA:acetate/3-ketoacid CoA transferase beta subunit
MHKAIALEDAVGKIPNGAPPGLEHPYLSDPGGALVGAVPGACSFDSCFSFGLIRGGHPGVTALAGLELEPPAVNERRSK